jgi:hypothetical protein
MVPPSNTKLFLEMSQQLNSVQRAKFSHLLYWLTNYSIEALNLSAQHDYILSPSTKQQLVGNIVEVLEKIFFLFIEHLKFEPTGSLGSNQLLWELLMLSTRSKFKFSSSSTKVSFPRSATLVEELENTAW